MLETVFNASGHLFTDVHLVHIPLLYCPRVLTYKYMLRMKVSKK